MSAPTNSTGRPLVVRALAGLLVFHGIAAIGGGAMFLVDTSGRMAGLDTALLEATPFATFLWPGVMLSLGLGVPALVTAAGILWRWSLPWLVWLERATGHHWTWSASLMIGSALIVWIVVQMLLIEPSWLQPAMFAVGIAHIVLAMMPATRAHLAMRAG